MNNFRKLAIYAGVSGLIYLVWLATHIINFISVALFIFELLIYLLIVLFIYNHWTRKYQILGGNYSTRVFVDIFIPTKNEPVEMLNETLAAAKKIIFPNKRIYIIDDGDRLEIKQLAKKYGVGYLVRPDRQSKAFKGATLNFAFQNSVGNFILALDADQIVMPKIFDDLLGYFTDPKVALVATRQQFNTPINDFNHDHVFYGYMQSGKNADDSGVSCGSGVIYRRSALQEIGGFQEWNIVEDLYTTYMLNAQGYKTLYISQSYTKGDAPSDLAVIYKQRGTWALDSLRLFFYQLPKVYQTKLTVRQFFHYFEMGYIYIISGLIIPGIYVINFYSLATNIPIINATIWYVILKIPSFYFALKLYNTLGQGDSSSRMWTALFPVYFKAIIQALIYKKPRYVVTEKKKNPFFHPVLVLPQMIFILIGVIATIYHLVVYGGNLLLLINFIWLVIMVYWIYPIFPKALFLSQYYARKNTHR